MNVMSSDERPSLVAQIARIATDHGGRSEPGSPPSTSRQPRRRIRVAENDKQSNSRDLFSDRHSEDRISRGMLWILSINVHFVVQRPSVMILKRPFSILMEKRPAPTPLGGMQAAVSPTRRVLVSTVLKILCM